MMSSAMWIESLGRSVDVPAGWYRVRDGDAVFGDFAWMKEGAGGQWHKITYYNVDSPVEGFWCVIREWVDDGAGI